MRNKINNNEVGIFVIIKNGKEEMKWRGEKSNQKIFMGMECLINVRGNVIN